jgi:hypothetical protein
LLAALLVPGIGFGATLTGSVTSSTATVDLASVGTLDWARWPGYTHRSNYISNVTTTGTYGAYWNDARLIGDRSGIKVGGVNASFDFTVAASTQERTLIYYFGGYYSNSRLTVTLPNATTYTATITGGTGNYDRVATIRFRADTNTTLRVRLVQTSTTGSIKMQAAALQGSASSTPPPSPTGSAILSWSPPTQNTNGTTLTNLTGYRIRWGTTQGTYPNSVLINNASARTYTVSNLAAGRWYFVITAVNSSGTESPYSNAVSKLVQ